MPPLVGAEVHVHDVLPDGATEIAKGREVEAIHLATGRVDQNILWLPFARFQLETEEFT